MYPPIAAVLWSFISLYSSESVEATNMFFSADEAGTKDAWQEALRRDHEENLLRPVRGRTGTYFLLENANVDQA